jgi:type II secretory pathway component PulJ
MKKRTTPKNGFSLIELLIATALFMVVTGAIFSLLYAAQAQYRAESGALSAFQQANIALDQIVRDVHSSGYPPANSFTSSYVSSYPDKVALPFAWSTGYPNSPCTVGTSCTVPSGTDLILEVDARNGTGLQWIRYSLSGRTLMRGVAAKLPATDPVSATNSTGMIAYLENVTNGSTPIFTYTFDPGATPRTPPNIRQVNICLMVESAQPDPKTGVKRAFTLNGQVLRFNPNQ